MKIRAFFKTHQSYMALLVISLLCSGCEVDEAQASNPPPSGSASVTLEPARGVSKNFATKVGINPFPYDITPDAVMRTVNLARSNGDLYTVQLDNGIPWQEALDGKPFSAKIMEEWSRHRDWKAGHQAVYLAIAPLRMDRKAWAEGFDGAAAPKWVSAQKSLTPDIQTAYINYVMRAVEYFQPDFINIGVEAMDLAHNDAKAWTGMETLFIETRKAIKSRYRKDVPVGMSVGLPLIMQPEVFERTRKAVAASDYLGISFYPHIKQFYDKIGGAPIPATPPQQWRQPLQWARDNFSIPLAICETSYSSQPVVVSKWGLDMPSSADAQALFVEDLAAIARRDQYLFVNFFLGIDYDALARRIPDPNQIMPLWKNTGFFDQHLNPKPAWAAYQRAWLNRSSPENPFLTASQPASQSVQAPAPATTPPATSDGSSSGGISFKQKSDLFVGPPTARFSLTLGDRGEPAMLWSYSYTKGEWAWAMGKINQPVQKNAKRLTFDIISNRSGPLFVQVIEKGGEAFVAEIQVGPQWKPIELNLAQMNPDPTKRQNGRLETDQIQSILLADGAAEQTAVKGQRDVYLNAPTFRP